MKARVMLALVILSSFALRAEAKAKKATPPAPSPAVTAPETFVLAAPWDRLSLKDGQSAEGKFKGYDAYFLNFVEKNGTSKQIPWPEVAKLEFGNPSGDAAIMNGHLTVDSVAVNSVIAPKDPSRAESAALWPGFFIHGSGYHEAGDDGMFYSLASLEVFGVGAAIFGASLVGDTADSQSDQQISEGLLIGGGVLFVGSWAWDLIGAGSAAKDYNASHQVALSLAPSAQGSLLCARLSF